MRSWKRCAAAEWAEVSLVSIAVLRRGGCVHQQPCEAAVGTPVAVPARITRGPVTLGKRCPIRTRKPILLEDDLAVSEGHLAGQPLVAAEPATIRVKVAEFSMFKSQYGHVR